MSSGFAWFAIGFAVGVLTVLALTLISAAHDYEDDHQ